LAERVSRRLGSDGDLSTRQAAVTIRLAINKVPQIWKDGHVALGQLWSLYCQYPYMPRLRDRRVLEKGILDLPMIWQTDAFALATEFGSATGRYAGLWLPTDKNSAPSPTDSLLLVRPDAAEKQREAEVDPPVVGPVDQPEINTPNHEPTHFVAIDTPTSSKTRFYGVKTISSEKIALDFRNISDEVLANLRRPGVDLVVKIEIEATEPSGFDENTVRTVSENAKTLKFDQSGFESF